MGNRGTGAGRRGFKKWFRDQREKIDRGPVGRGIRATRRGGTVILRTIRQLGETFWSLLIPGVAGLLILLLFLALVVELLSPGKPDPKLIGTLASFILLAAVAARLGETLKDRLKKLGPLELFAAEVHDLLATLDRLELRLSEKGKGLSELSPEEKWKYEQADRYVSQVEHSNLKVNGAAKARFQKLLFKVAATALQQEDPWRARERLELLLRYSSERDELANVHHLLGRAYLECTKQRGPTETERQLELEKAAHHFRRAAKERPERHEYLFLQAYALDELKCYGGAFDLYDKVLKLRPQFAPAKYNGALSLLNQKGKEKKAKELLLSIETTDEGVETLKESLQGPDLEKLWTDPSHEADVKQWVEQMLASLRGPRQGV